MIKCGTEQALIERMEKLPWTETENDYGRIENMTYSDEGNPVLRITGDGLAIKALRASEHIQHVTAWRTVTLPTITTWAKEHLQKAQRRRDLSDLANLLPEGAFGPYRTSEK
jgi:hypothetical protein